MNTAIAVRNNTDLEQWEVSTKKAASLVKSGFLPKDVNTPEKALAIILLGRELGIGEMTALNNINVIQGKPTVPPQLMLALINRTGQLEDIGITDDGQACTVTMKRQGRKPHSATFSIQDAQRMKTQEKGNTISLSEKYNWKQMPQIMRQWRAVAACARVVFPDVITGLYTPDEMGAAVDAEGEVIDLPAEPTPDPATIEAEPEPTEAALEEIVNPGVSQERWDAFTDLLWANHKLGYDYNALGKWLKKKYGIDERLNIVDALLSLGEGELAEAIGIFDRRLKAAEQEAA